MKEPKVSIIVLNYNGLEYLKKCLASIKKQSYKNIEVVVTDNHSTDGSVEYVKKLKDVKLIANPDNYGFAKANNIGVERATGEFVFILNNDTELYEDCIENLVLNYQPKSILAATQIRPWEKDKQGVSSIGVDIFGYPFADHNPLKTKPFYADGASIFIRKDDYLKIGGFDEELFIFEEDIDLSWRAQMMGYEVLACWEAKLIHYGGATVLGGVTKTKTYSASYFRHYLNVKNVVRNIIKNYSFPLNILILLILMAFHVAEIIVLTLILKFKVVKCYIDAYLWNILHLPNTLAYRQKVQSKRVVSDGEIMKRMYWSYSKVHALFRHGVPEFK